MSLSNVSLVMAILLLLQMHACIARHPSHFLSFTKLQDADETKLVHHELDVNGFRVFEEATQNASEDLAFGVEEKNARIKMQMQDIKGKPRAMLESNNKAKEAIDANEGAAVDEDYVAHRRSPIHNHH